MIYSILFHPLAESEYVEAFQWYEKQLEGLGERFERAVEEKLKQISSKPQLFPIKKGAFHEAKVDRFPYLIIFSINRGGKTVFITSVFHTSRYPRKKYRKR